MKYLIIRVDMIFAIPLIFFSLGLWLVIYSIPNLFFLSKIKKWKEVSGCITELGINGRWLPIHEKVALPNKIQLKYQYEYKGKQYWSTTLNNRKISKISRLHNQKDSITVHDLYEFQNKIIKSPNIKVWVNVDAKNESVIIKYKPDTRFYFLLGIVLIIWSVTLSLLMWEMNKTDISERIEIAELKNLTSNDTQIILSDSTYIDNNYDQEQEPDKTMLFDSTNFDNTLYMDY